MEIQTHPADQLPEFHEILATPEVISPSEGYHSREQLVGALVMNDLLSEEYAASGALDSFQIDEKTGTDALKHVLVGDENGGAHHLRTIIELEVPGRTVASTYTEPDAENGQRSRKKCRNNQSMRPNGTYRAYEVAIDEADEEKEKVGGSVMFPDEWTSEKVIGSIRQVSKKAPDAYDTERPDKAIHNGEVDGVRIRVVTNPRTGKIVTGYPKYNKK